MKPNCPNCNKSDRVHPNGETPPSKKSGKRERWVCKRAGCGSWSVPIDPNYAKLAPIRALRAKDKKAIAMWVSLMPTECIENLLGVKYEVYSGKVLKIFEMGVWAEMVKEVRQVYPDISDEAFDRLKSSSHDFVTGKQGFRQMVSGQQEYWKSLDEDEQDELFLKWTVI